MKSISFLLIILAIFCSCNSNKKRYQAIEDIATRSLRKSNEALSQFSFANYSALSEKLRDENFGEHAVLWNKKATRLKELTTEILHKIETIDTKNKSANDTLFFLKQKYVHDILLLDSNLAEKFRPSIDSFLINYGTLVSPSFSNEKSKNDILILESRFSEYFKFQLGYIIEDYTQFSALVSQNKTHLKPGETLEIAAGIGSYTIAAKPTFLIDGKTIFPDENALAKYKVKAQGKGKKNIPIKITFTRPNGEKALQEFNIEYYVDE